MTMTDYERAEQAKERLSSEAAERGFHISVRPDGQMILTQATPLVIYTGLVETSQVEAYDERISYEMDALMAGTAVPEAPLRRSMLTLSKPYALIGRPHTSPDGLEAGTDYPYTAEADAIRYRIGGHLEFLRV